MSSSSISGKAKIGRGSLKRFFSAPSIVGEKTVNDVDAGGSKRGGTLDDEKAEGERCTEALLEGKAIESGLKVVADLRRVSEERVSVVEPLDGLQLEEALRIERERVRPYSHPQRGARVPMGKRSLDARTRHPLVGIGEREH